MGTTTTSTEYSVRELVDCSPVAAVVSDPRKPDNPLIACNHAFVELTGYGEDEILGRNCRFLAGPGTEPWLTETIRKGVRDRKPVMVEILNYKKDGTPFRNAVVVAPIFDDDGELAYFFGSQIELCEDSQGPSLTRRVRATEKIKDLSKRQLEVLRMVASGLRNKQIAWELGLSEKTIKMHRGIAMEKLGAQSSAEMIRLAVEAGI
ncbi:LuxR C-terminal-related transcriptional regulator [Aurantiacibacter poecillastricola]|uniref:LuxR C-terminal-related transcriptional regulator n=1 Tax=Aurantiacibacter poecillastricola TaxID=3064385 RepID=UPI00273E1872|nr:LuxR C-terminal-related transcriptional regulator [Aurantiacibacter sp. 219JJ12-13]MDP5262427.1 LuxR C-terminal-related transcriptional regulator [Aurantiacibacter sp. 219JJ12-13]